MESRSAEENWWKMEREMEAGMMALVIQKFHCELNPIERVWSQAVDEGILRLHYRLTLTDHSSGAEECF